MEEIKVNEYIRTFDGDIDRIITVMATNGGSELIAFKKRNYYLSNIGLEKIIKKHSPRLKDLVQAGDIILYSVNSKMTDIEIVKEHIDARTQKKTLRVGMWSLEQVEIKEILTKEQFNQMKYIVGDESNVKD